jgi:hypothetical protein
MIDVVEKRRPGAFNRLLMTSRSGGRKRCPSVMGL